MNSFIGNPIELMKEYSSRTDLRSIESMTSEEATLIINIAIDNGDWKGQAVNNIQISSKAGNFVEGDVSFGGKETYHFSIAWDGTVQIYILEFDEEKVRFIPSGGLRKIYRFSDIIFVMMKYGFNIHKHLL